MLSVVAAGFRYHGYDCVFGIRFASASTASTAAAAAASAPVSAPAPLSGAVAASAVYDVDCFAFP